MMCATLSAHHSTVAYVRKPHRAQECNDHESSLGESTHHPDIRRERSPRRVVGWSAETGSPGSVARVGWNRNSVKPGDKVTIELYPARNGAHVGRLKKVIFPDGRELLDTQNPTSLKK